MTASDLNRLRSLLRTVDRILNNDLRTQDGSGRDTTEENLRQYRNNANELIATATTGWSLLTSKRQANLLTRMPRRCLSRSNGAT
jgi:hypothetical protein